MSKNMDKKFLEGIDPESVKDMEEIFQDVLIDDYYEKKGEGEKEYEEWKEEVEGRYAEAPGELKEWATKIVNDKLEELGEFYEELSGLDYREKHSYVLNLVLPLIEHPDFQESEDMEKFLDSLKKDAEIALEKWMLERSLQIRKMLKNAEEGWRGPN